MKRLSIITINLNNVNGLKKTIDSVIEQDFDDYEYLIFDGGSTDGSKELILSYGQYLNYWRSNKDNGIFNAMNEGVAAAKGEYLLFLNSGDFLIERNVLSKAFKLNFEEDIVVGNCVISKDGKKVFEVVPPDEISLSAFFRKTIPHQASFIKANLFKEAGCYSEEYSIHADYEFFLRALIVNNCGYRHINITITDYNLEGISSSPKNTSISSAEYQEIIERLIPTRILIDYNNWELQQKHMAPLYWIKSKKILFNICKIFFETAIKLIKLRKSLGFKLKR